MDEKFLNILEKLHHLSSKNQDGWVVSLDLGVRGEKFDCICNFLRDNDFVTKLEKIGQTKITCHVTQKLCDLLKEDLK